MSSRSLLERVRSKVSVARRMSWAERRLFVAVWIMLVGITISTKFAGFHRTRAALEGTRLRPGSDTASDAPERVLATSRLVDAASRNTGLHHTCLHRSLTLWWLMRRRGVDVTLKLGARLCSDGLEAHAWVEHAGFVVNDPEAAAGGYTDLTLEPMRPDA